MSSNLVKNPLKIPALTWQQEMQQAVTQLDDLCARLSLSIEQLGLKKAVADGFALKVPQSFVARMVPGDARDPLLRQILPQDVEWDAYPGFTEDPLKEASANPVPGLLHKYHGRVLLLVAGACSLHCRYCFRRHFPYEDNNPGLLGWQTALRYIEADTSIHEVIFSGGDPLMASDKVLGHLVQRLSDIPHVKTVRIHSRMPVTIPARITPEFIAWFTDSRLKPVLVLHTNHANEIDDTVAAVLHRLRESGVTLLNQTVILKGINDHVDALKHLSERLFEVGVLPYYLHLLDKVKGAGHFDVSESRAIALLGELRAVLPGYLVPKLVKEEAGFASKSVIA